jgi:hypothetical protein
MAVSRVEKGWQEKGLESYSTPEILATLAHYGIPMEERAFVAAAETEYPLGIALRWAETWKGTGQFSRFPAAAALELWRRWLPNAAAPGDLALAFVNLLRFLEARIAGEADDGTQDTRFKVVEAYLRTLPTAEARRAEFLSELLHTLGAWLGPLEEMVRALGRKGLVAEGERWVSVEEALFPDRAGASRVMLKALTGNRDEALAELEGLGLDAARPMPLRIAAVGCLLQLDEPPRAKALLLPLAREAQEARDVELAIGVAELLTHLLEADLAREEWGEVHAAVDALERAFPEIEPHEHSH